MVRPSTQSSGDQVDPSQFGEIHSKCHKPVPYSITDWRSICWMKRFESSKECLMLSHTLNGKKMDIKLGKIWFPLMLGFEITIHELPFQPSTVTCPQCSKLPDPQKFPLGSGWCRPLLERQSSIPERPFHLTVSVAQDLPKSGILILQPCVSLRIISCLPWEIRLSEILVRSRSA